MIRVALIAAILLTPVAASAQTITVKLDEQTERLLGPGLPMMEKQLQATIAKKTQALVGDANVGEFLDMSASSQALVHKGLGADYGGDADGLIVGIGVAVAADGSDTALDFGSGDDVQSLPVGAGAQLSAMAGYNFAAQGLPSLTVFIHGMAAPINFSKFDGSFYNIGAHAQVRLVEPKGSRAFGWGGLRVTSGVAVSRLRLTVLSEEDFAFDTTINGVRIQGDSEGRLSLVQSAVSIPAELTTSLTMLGFLTVYGGIAGDIDFGTANLELEVDTTISSGLSVEDGTAQASFENAGASDRVRFRLVTGAQATFGAFNLFAQANVIPADGMLAVSGGTRVLF